ncbi:hypothetical protein AT3G05935 [Arabidopsis thaliana]|uniref:Uncharacterized protein n=1 Tax=Arabidopsis thaliana TaxID=3702 RepID=A0A1I9LLN1_ARATH|nr:uncharacterized protein AT3G05935 [Arabidopsis thaliana]ANM63489.1 hypothetical protein AT3G05935 [Arabidopsis thaliana]|eukprot:NP_001325573.1 hypothetical protein AT3G05935 [Arabidopsis thaliana]
MNNEQNERDPDNINNKKKKKESPLLIYSVSKAKKRIVSKFRRRPLSPNTSPSSGFWKRVCFCGIEPDPEDDNFKLRVLLQTNDFFSKDSNPHLCFPERLGKQVIRNRWVRTKQRWSNNLSPGKLAIESSEDGSRSFVRVLLEMEESFGENENVSFVDVFGDEFPGSG